MSIISPPPPGGMGSLRAAIRKPLTGSHVAIEKRKWDGTISSRSSGWLLEDLDGRRCWLVPAGTADERPRLGRVEHTAIDTISVAAGAWWIVSVKLGPDGEPGPYRVNAGLSPGRPYEGVLRWVDLDLDLILDGPDVELRDHADFRRRARTMAYPPEVREGALGRHPRRGVFRHAAGEWPFDGSLGEGSPHRRASCSAASRSRRLSGSPPAPDRAPLAREVRSQASPEVGARAGPRQRRHAGGQGRRVARRDEHGAAPAERLPAARRRRGHHPAAGGERLERRQPVGLGRVRVHEAVGRRHQRGQPVALGHVAQQADAARDPQARRRSA